jgi:acetyltransferase-like isoleucine patch superfamily enzyme
MKRSSLEKMAGTQKQKRQPYRDLKPPDRVQTIFDDFLARFEENINDPKLDRNDVVRDTLYQLYLAAVPNFTRLHDYKFPIGARALVACFDPRNATLDPEYDSDLNPDLYSPRKPLIWFWHMFDRSPLGLNAHLGLKLRQMLAPYIFKKVGSNFRCAALVQWSFGYNLSVGDDVVIGRQALLDDRGGLDIGSHVQIGEFVVAHSHAPGAINEGSVNKDKIVIGDHVRIGFHSTILPGVHIGQGAVVEPMSLVARNVKPHDFVAGTWAESVSPQPKGRAKGSAS